MDMCTCTKDKEITCIVHPTTRSLKRRIAELEAENKALREAAEYILRADLTIEEHMRGFDMLKELLEVGDE